MRRGSPRLHLVTLTEHLPLPTTRAEASLLWNARPAMAAILAAGHAARRLPAAKDGRGLFKVAGIGWVTSDPVIAREILKHRRAFSIVGEGGVGHLWAQVLGDWVIDLFDGPGHHDLRGRTRELFTDAMARELVAEAWADSLAQVRHLLARGHSVDVARVSRVLVGRIMIAILGIRTDGGNATDTEALHTFHTGEKLARLALGTASSTVLDEPTLEAARTYVAQMTAGVPDAWASAPEHTIIGRCRKLGLSLRETTGLAALLMIAGTETSASAMMRTTALLIDTGQQHAYVAAIDADRRRHRRPGEPSPTDIAVREGLRVTSPASVIGRNVAADVQIAGRDLRAGERVMMLVWSANAGVGGYRLDRPYVAESRQLWFGAGRHLCLGAALARQEIGAFLATLWADEHPLVAVSRRAQRRVLVPGYESLLVARAAGVHRALRK